MVNAFRFGMLGSSDISIGTAYVIIVSAVVVLFTTVFYLLDRGIGIRA
jgi:ABC-2 type transport system permease protein